MNFLAFRADAVAATVLDDVGTFVVVLAQNVDGSGERLEVQRALEFDDRDRRLGEDTYCISDSSGATSYGGVLSWELKRGALHLLLTEPCARVMGVAGYIVDYPPEHEALLQAGLQRAIGG